MADEQLDALKIPPHSVDAEQSVLGGLLLENDALDKVADILSAQDFYRHERICFRYRGVEGQAARGRQVHGAVFSGASADRRHSGLEHGAVWPLPPL